MGTRTRIGRGSHINAVGRVYIGNNVMIGPYVIVTTVNHKFNDRTIPMNQQGLDVQDVHINNDVWIDAFAVILPGITVGEGAVVGAGAVVTQPVEPFTIVGGVPARVISHR